MTILKLLNKKNLLIFLSFFFFQNVFSNEPVDIWNIEKKLKIKNIKKIESENVSIDSVFGSQTIVSEELSINEETSLSTDNIHVVGIYDPSENDLSIDMWDNSNGKQILKIINKIEKMNLSEDAREILNIALLTNSYFPRKNINYDDFLKIKSNWLIKQQNLNLIETYLQKNKNLEDNSKLIRYYLDYYLSKSDVNKACQIFDKTKVLIKDNYLSKFKIYCLVVFEKRDEAQLHFDLLKELNFKDIFFEKKFSYLMGYDNTIGSNISEKSLLDFHLSHRTNPDFNFEPKIDTSKLIWKYLSFSNLLENIDFIDLEDKDKIFTIEKATHDKNYEEKELFTLYERFMFNINQLLTVNETHKLLPKSEARALLYQCILLNKDNASKKIKLIKILKDSFENDEISNAFDLQLVKFLKEIKEEEVPSNYTEFYKSNLQNKNISNRKIKFNNKIIHQSKLLNYFKEESNAKNIEKDLEILLKKVKKDKKYFFSIKDVILLETLKFDGIKIPKKYQNIYEPVNANVPSDIQNLINNEDIGVVLLRLVEIIGEDKIENIDSDTIYFITSILNQIGVNKLRNRILIKILPLKV